MHFMSNHIYDILVRIHWYGIRIESTKKFEKTGQFQKLLMNFYWILIDILSDFSSFWDITIAL